jgi:hypothetical protein
MDEVLSDPRLAYYTGTRPERGDFGFVATQEDRWVAAVWLLFLPADAPGYGFVSEVVRSELRLQATDFWLRNPDYLADEFLTLVESGAIDVTYIETARTLLEDPGAGLALVPHARSCWFRRWI